MYKIKKRRDIFFIAAALFLSPTLIINCTTRIFVCVCVLPDVYLVGGRGGGLICLENQVPIFIPGKKSLFFFDPIFFLFAVLELKHEKNVLI